MDPTDLARELAAIPGRAPCSDAERRAAILARERLAAAGRETVLETFWAHPNIAAADAWAALLGIAGSLLSVAEPRAGLALLAATLACVAAELSGLRMRPLRLLTPRRATQNVLSPPRAGDGRVPAFTLTVVAGCDAPTRARGLARALRAVANGLWPSGRAWLGATLLVLVITAGLHSLGEDSRAVEAVQLAATLALLVALLGLVEAAFAPPGDGAEQAGAVAAAVALAGALDAVRTRRLGVEVLIAGASSAGQAGVERWVRRSLRKRRAERTAVLAIAACGPGPPAWRRSDGPLLRLRAHPKLLELCHRVAREEPGLATHVLPGRAMSAALPPRRAGRPSVCVECDPRAAGGKDRPPPGAGGPEAMLEFCLALVGALDDELARARPAPAAAAARAG